MKLYKNNNNNKEDFKNADGSVRNLSFNNTKREEYNRYHYLF